MWKFWLRHAPVWSAADTGGGSGDDGGEGGGTDDAGKGDETGDGGDDTGDSGKSSILDFATKKGGEGDDEGDPWKLPDGMEVPEHLVGSTADDTLAKVAKAYAGARRELSKKGKDGLEGTVPETPEGYVFEAEGDDDAVAAELNSEASKPYVDAFRAAAHKLGVPDATFTKLMREGLSGIAEGGIPIGVSNEDATEINGQAEMASLVEEVGQAGADTIVNTIDAYAEKLAGRGVLKDEADVGEFAQMVGTARAARIFHRILTGELGEKPIPSAVGADGTVTPEEAYARYAEAMKLPEGSERDAALKDAERAMQKAFGNSLSSTGAVRSNVL